MKIAVYGVPCAGKNDLIDAVIQYLHANTSICACHLSRISTLQHLAREKFGQDFFCLDENNAAALYQDFIHKLTAADREYDVVFVEANYAVLDTRDSAASCRPVMLRDEYSAYDAFFYLDPEPATIAQRTFLSVAVVQQWQETEKQRLSHLCSARGLELIIVDEDTDSVCRFIREYLDDTDKNRFYASGIARAYLAQINTSALPDNIMLLDCDNTLSCNDVSADFFSQAGLNGGILQTIFRGYRYTHYQFYRIAHFFDHTPYPRLEEAAHAVLTRLRRNEPLLHDLRSHTDSYKIAVTSGMTHAWRQMQNQGWFDTIIGYSLPNTNARFVTPAVKAAIARELQTMGKHVLAVGDSLLDIPMLEQADAGYLIARDSVGVRRYFAEHPHTSIIQLGYSPCRYGQLAVQDALPCPTQTR